MYRGGCWTANGMTRGEVGSRMSWATMRGDGNAARTQLQCCSCRSDLGDLDGAGEAMIMTGVPAVLSA